MFKKATLAVAAVLIVGGLLFGGNAIPYAKAIFSKAVTTANDAIPVETQIDAAKQRLKNIGPEVNEMVRKIAKEKAEIKRLEKSVAKQSQTLKSRYDAMMTLKSHLSSGDEVYVATNGNAYTNERVAEDLRHRFNLYTTAEKTRDKNQQILDLRQQALTSAFAQLEEAQAQQRELEVQIENLTARNRVQQVAASAMSLKNFDNTELSKTREMIEDISARLDTQDEMLELAPTYYGQIPVGDESPEQGNIVDQMDAYFDNQDADSETMVLIKK